MASFAWVMTTISVVLPIACMVLVMLSSDTQDRAMLCIAALLLCIIGMNLGFCWSYPHENDGLAVSELDHLLDVKCTWQSSQTMALMKRADQVISAGCSSSKIDDAHLNELDRLVEIKLQRVWLPRSVQASSV